MKLKISILIASLICTSCATQLALKDFKNLPKEISVETIGNRQVLDLGPLLNEILAGIEKAS